MSEQAKLTLLQTVFKRIWTIAIAIILIIAISLVWPFLWNNGPVRYADINNHFKYGSIGGEQVSGIPYWIWKVLPVTFADKLPGNGYTSLGFLQEPEQDLPIGFSKSKIGLERVAQNCATCHVGSLRETPNSPAQIITTMPSNTVDLEGYIKFLSDIAIDARFNAREMMPQIEAMGAKLNPLEKLVYRYLAIPQTRDALILQRSKFAFMDSQSNYGPGRVDTFSGYKTRQFNFPLKKLSKDELNGIVDFPSIWQQRPRQGMQLHWDGNNDSVDERNNSAALALVTPTTINFDAIHRIKDWLLDLPPPPYPYAINPELASTGKPIFDNNCASCHAFGSSHIGKVVPIEEINTDRGRLDSYTNALAANQYTLFAGITYQGEDQRFTHFRKTNGYANLPLDGIWLRAPYLHNGSVPTLWDLLQKTSDRPIAFYRGNDLYDPEKVGFVADVAAENGKRYFLYDTRLSSNGNGGHLYGTELSTADKKALLEYLKGI